MRSKRQIILFILLGFFVIGDSAASASAADKPNVLFIVADDMNTDLACYGHSQTKTPHLDRLAARGTRFEHAYCQVPVCNPSRVSFLTGTYPRSVKDPVYLPNHFQAQGYETVEIGKVAHSYGPSREKTRWDRELKGAGETAAKVLREKRDKPVFLALGIAYTHSGIAYDRSFRDFYSSEKVPLPVLAGDGEAPPIAYTGLSRPERTEAELRERIVRYYGAISAADAEIGILMDALDDAQLWDNTIVVFFSDHGMHLGERGIADKRSLFEPAVHVPLIVVAPRQKPDVSSRMVELVDVFPTLTALCGIPAPQQLQGQSLVPLLENPRVEWDDMAISFSPMVRGARSIRTPTHRLTSWGSEGLLELYNYENDPHEQKNLAADPAQAKLVAELKSKLDAATDN